MAINCFDIKPCKKVSLMSECSTNISKKDNFPSRLDNINFVAKSSVASVTSRLRKSYKSPYLVEDKTQPATRPNEKKAVQKWKADLVSSFPLAVSLYKANSDEFKSIKGNRKVKKSVLTLPNQRCFIHEKCTVSDMNDSEYFNNDDGSHKARPKKRTLRQSNKKFRDRNKDFGFNDINARYCSHLNADLDSSSTDMIRHFNGDGRTISQRKKPHLARKSQAEKQFTGHNVWKVLQDMNRFQFRPSPPASDDTIVTPRKKNVSKRHKRKDSRFIGTCHTEEYAYISSIEVDSKSKSFSQSSSFDRITVIDKEDDFSKLCEEFEKTIVHTHNLAKDVNINNCIPAKNKIKNINKPRVNKLCKFKDRQIKSIGNTATIMTNENYFEDENYQGNFIVPNENTIRKSKYPVEHSNDHLNIIKSEHKHETDGTGEFHDHFIHSGNSGSSKAACNYLKDHEMSFKLSSDESSQHIKGITKVVLSKDQDRMKLQKRKPRLFTTIPSTTIIPKLTQTDIKRRLASIKFPLVILGKDQVSSSMEVIDFYDHPQFTGLDKHIWPFMLEWNNDFTKTADYIKSHKNIENNTPKTKRYTVQAENKFTNLRKTNKIVTKEKRVHNIGTIINQKLKEEDQPILEIKQSIYNVKDKMIELIYKKSPSTNLFHVTQQVGGGDVIKNITSKDVCSKNDIGGNRNLTHSPSVKEPLKNRQRNSVNPASMKDRLSIMKISKTKPINLVEMITMNIKNGVYYNEDKKYFDNKQETISKEASIQTTFKDIQEVQTDQVECLKSSTSKEIFSKCHSLIEAIPGFDYTLPELEIKTLNLNKIEVKHCLSNILVQFDVITLPINPNINLKRFKKSYSFIPLEVSDHETKVFKCKTSILNSMLPAELCSILPKIMRHLIMSEVKTLPLLPVSKTESHLSTISELSHFENTDSLKMSQIYLGHFFAGLFFKPSTTNPKQFINKFEWPGRTRILDLLPPITNKLILFCDLSPREIVYIRELRTDTSLKSQDIREIPIHNRTFCTTVQSYDLRNWRVATTFKPYDFNDMISKICAYYLCAFVTSTMPLISFDMTTNRLSVNITLNKDNQEKVLLSLNDLKTNTLYGNFSNILSNKIECSNGKITNMNEIPICKNTSLSQVKRSTTGLKRNRYVKLYKKCKSTTNIPSERHSTSLNKIENLDDFFQLLGCRKSFSGVFDGHAARKVIACIVEMKNWILEINSSQALLVLLLANKKDTPNLVRFRSILLQGIAVNRITKLSELDMEIEVIERENLNSSLQIEGISYLPASVENKDNLLEELYWIAKTTASDYQRPFDESSEKLLKSLLERRKKLNPSYLRLIARYVGLGLLKSPLRK